VYHQYTLRVAQRDKVSEALTSKNRWAFIPVPLHLQPVYKVLGYRKDNCPKQSAPRTK
jgi:dTDP-4-amino-4,6-dideoxygalactose transaminase